MSGLRDGCSAHFCYCFPRVKGGTFRFVYLETLTVNVTCILDASCLISSLKLGREKRDA